MSIRGKVWFGLFHLKKALLFILHGVPKRLYSRFFLQLKGVRSLQASVGKEYGPFEEHTISLEKRLVFTRTYRKYDDAKKGEFFSLAMGATTLIGKSLTPIVETNYLVAESFQCLNTREALHRGALYDPPSKVDIQRAQVMQGAYYSLVNHWTRATNYYHWLLDVLPMIQLMSDESKKILIRPIQAPFQKQTLELLGVWERCVEVTEDVVKLKDFTYVSPPSCAMGMNARSVKFLQESFGHFRKPQKPGLKIYLSRRGAIRSAINEDVMERELQAKGWLIVNAHEYSFIEQIELFSEASQICGVHGANLTNLLWAQPGTKVTEYYADNWLVQSNENIALLNTLEYTPVILPGEWKAQVTVPQPDYNQL